MKQTIYVDVLVSVNLIVDYFLLYAAALLTGRQKDRVRMCLGAVIGAVGSLAILLPRMPVVGVMITVSVSALMALAAFRWRGWRSFFYSLMVLYGLSVLYSGLMLLLWSICGSRNISVNNGAVYINIDPALLILTTVILYAVISLFSGKIRARGLSRKHCTVTIYQNNHKTAFEGLVDTGNTLTEPFSGIPVLVATEKMVRNIAPVWVCGAENEENYQQIAGRYLRLVPYHTAGGSGIMKAFRPERIDIDIDGSTVSNVSAYIAVTQEESRTGGMLLVNPDVLN